jgi:osmotically-inducible protein OsmY
MDEKARPVQTTDSPQVAEEARIAEEVARAIAHRGLFPPVRVQVSTLDGTVKLRGRVASYYHKQVAQVAALTVIGPRQLVNEIEVT